MVTVEWRFLYIGFFLLLGLDRKAYCPLYWQPWSYFCHRFVDQVVRHPCFTQEIFIFILCLRFNCLRTLGTRRLFQKVWIRIFTKLTHFRCLVPYTLPVQPLTGLVHIFISLALFFFYIFFRTISFLNVSDAILWRQAVLLKTRGRGWWKLSIYNSLGEAEERDIVDFEGAMKFDL